MRGLIVLAVVVLGMLVAGWLTFHRGNGTASVTVETDKIQQDTTRLVEHGKEALDGATDRVKAGLEKSTPASTREGASAP